MELFAERVDVWAAPIQDKPGGLADVLGILREAGVDLKFIIARRAPDQPGKGVLFVTPLQSDGEIRAAAQIGFNVTHTLYSVRVLGRDRPGIAAELTQKLADASINLRGFSRRRCCLFMVRRSLRRRLLISRSKDCRGWTTSPSMAGTYIWWTCGATVDPRVHRKWISQLPAILPS